MKSMISSASKATDSCLNEIAVSAKEQEEEAPHLLSVSSTNGLHVTCSARKMKTVKNASDTCTNLSSSVAANTKITTTMVFRSKTTNSLQQKHCRCIETHTERCSPVPPRLPVAQNKIAKARAIVEIQQRA